jgi:hypothetical protein
MKLDKCSNAHNVRGAPIDTVVSDHSSVSCTGKRTHLNRHIRRLVCAGAYQTNAPATDPRLALVCSITHNHSSV